MNLVFVTFATPVTFVVETTSHRYQSHVVEYGDFLERNSDGTHNVTSPLVQIYIIYKTNNDSYILKKMRHQSDRYKFINTMKKEVLAVFILTKVDESEARK